MSATPHSQDAITNMGAQFKENIFDKVPGKLLKVAKSARALPGVQSGSGTTNFRATSSNGTKPAASTLPRTSAPKALGSASGGLPATPASGGSRGPSSAPNALPAGRPVIKATATRLDQNNSSGTGAHAMSPVRSGLPGGSFNRPALSGPAPRVFALGSGGSSVKHTQNSTQFANVTPKANDPYPTHEHPEGSSNLKLANLTADQPRQNEFTVGSRNAKPGGIAARGSQLEAWAISKSSAVQARQASRRAGGRDKTLSGAAKVAENFANQPLKNFAP